MLVEFIGPSQTDRVTLTLPHPTSEDPIDVTLVSTEGDSYQRSLACIYIEIAEFAQEASSLPDGWEGKVSFSSLEDDFVVLCRARRGDSLLMDFILESEPNEPNWIARASFEVPVSQLQLTAQRVGAHVKQC